MHETVTIIYVKLLLTRILINTLAAAAAAAAHENDKRFATQRLLLG